LEIEVPFHQIQNQVITIGYLLLHNKQIIFEHSPEFIKTGLEIYPFYLSNNQSIFIETERIFVGLY
jgi:hypothetical protein